MAAVMQHTPGASTSGDAPQMSEFQKLLLQSPSARPGYEDALGYELLKTMASGDRKSVV